MQLRIGGEIDRRAPGLKGLDLLARVPTSTAGEGQRGEEPRRPESQGFFAAAMLSFFAFSPFASWRAFRL